MARVRFAVPVLLMLSGALPALAGGSFPGNPADMYLTSDAANEVYQFERTSPWSYVPGTYAGSAMPQVFSNTSQVGGIGMYLGCVAGPNQDFWLGGFSGLTRIDSTTGANIQNVGGSTARLGPARAPNGNVAVGGPSGIEEFDTSGNFVRTITGTGSGVSLLTFNGNTMYSVPWAGGGAQTIQLHNFVSGAPLGSIGVPFAPQEIAFGPDGALYASALYESPSFEGLYRYDGSAWNLFADTSSLSGTGPHGFAWDPVSLDLYLAFQTGEIQRFDGLSGAYLNQTGFVPTKLTDILFTEVVPAPGSLAVLGIGGLVLARRRR